MVGAPGKGTDWCVGAGIGCSMQHRECDFPGIVIQPTERLSRYAPPPPIFREAPPASIIGTVRSIFVVSYGLGGGHGA